MPGACRHPDARHLPTRCRKSCPLDSQFLPEIGLTLLHWFATMKPAHLRPQDLSVFELHAEVCKVFSHPKRLQIINALREDELTVTQVVEHLRIPKANVSQHLAMLRQKGVVATRREGLNIYYRIANPKIIQAFDLMRQVLLEQLDKGKTLAKRLKAGY